MLWKWPIRVKLLVGLGLLMLVVGILSLSGLYATYAYRDLVKSLSWRVSELPVAAELGRHVGDLRITLSELHGLHANTFPNTHRDEVPLCVRMVRDQFQVQLDRVEDTLSHYRTQLEHKLRVQSWIADNQGERETIQQIEAALVRVREANRDQQWMLDDLKIDRLDTELENLQELAADLPGYLHAKLGGFAREVRGQYRTLIVGTWITSISAALIFLLFVQLSWKWILRPLQILIYGSRQVAAGYFGYRIHLDTHDEMSELADAMNDMTARFEDIRDDLDAQVQERTKQVLRSEQLASVGFLAAGVAHEINNPLASIAMCAESLQSRVGELLDPVGGVSDGDTVVADHEGRAIPRLLSPTESPPTNQSPPANQSPHTNRSPHTDQCAIIRHYLQMVQDEAFRCKQITEKLLDFSRTGQVERQNTNVGELVQDMVDMMGHLGRYRQKQIKFVRGKPVIVPVNAPEIKQVVLNLLTNALDSLEEDGAVEIELHSRDGFAELTFTDNGCGMEPEVLEHVFEPFFTRRRAGQGTGLGLSISYRIIADHGGEIQAESPGTGQGATFRVLLPLTTKMHKETENQYQAA